MIIQISDRSTNLNQVIKSLKMLKRFFKTNRKPDDVSRYGRRPVRTPNCFDPNEDSNKRNEVIDQESVIHEECIEEQIKA